MKLPPSFLLIFRRQNCRRRKVRRRKFRRRKFRRQKLCRQKLCRQQLRSIKRRISSNLLGYIVT